MVYSGVYGPSSVPSQFSQADLKLAKEYPQTKIYYYYQSHLHRQIYSDVRRFESREWLRPVRDTWRRR